MVREEYQGGYIVTGLDVPYEGVASVRIEEPVYHQRFWVDVDLDTFECEFSQSIFWLSSYEDMFRHEYQENPASCEQMFGIALDYLDSDKGRAELVGATDVMQWAATL